jgi:tetratricopeptide (TPR) repeat protein
MTYTLSRCALLVVTLTVTGCSVYSLPGSGPPPVETPAGEPVERVPVTPPVASPAPPVQEQGATAAYAPLLAWAEEASQRGDYEQALALLERAQRIDPDSAEVYLAMARTHDRRGDPARARATAERGLLYCGDPGQCAALRHYTR